MTHHTLDQQVKHIQARLKDLQQRVRQLDPDPQALVADAVAALESALMALPAAQAELEKTNTQLQAEITARQRALHESEQKYRLLAENVEDVIWQTDETIDHYTYISPSITRLLGYTPDEMLNMSLLAHLRPASRAHVEHAVEQRFTAERAGQGDDETRLWEVAYIRKDGSTVWVESTTRPLRDKDGIFQGLAGVTRDISRRKRVDNITQARLRIAQASTSLSSQALMQMTLDEIEALTGSEISFYHIVLDDQNTVALQTWSTNTLESSCRADSQGSHYPLSEAGVWVDCLDVGGPVIHNDYATLPHRKGLPPGHAPIIRELVLPIMRGKRVEAILGVGNKASNYDQKDIEIVSLLGDFSWEMVQRKRVEEALRESETQYRALIHRIQVAVIIHAADTRIIASNPKAQTLLGLTQDQMLGKASLDSEWQFLRADGTPMPLAEYPVNRVLATRHLQKDLIVGIHRPNKDDVVWCLTSANPVLDAKGTLQQVIVTFVDITERKHMENALRTNQEFLQRTGEMARVGGWEINIETQHVMWTATTKTIHEVPEAYEPTLEEAIAFFPGESRERITQAVERAMTHGEAYDLELEFVTAKGNHLWVHTIGKPEMAAGQCVRLAGMFQDITPIKHAQLQLQAALQEKNTLLRELYHRTKNNMQVICAMLDLQTEYIENQDTIMAFTEMQNRIQSMALVHQKLYESENLSSIDLGTYIVDLAQFVRSSYPITSQRVTFKFDVENLPVLIDTAMPCGLILNELISNALKHAFPDQKTGQVHIRLTKNKNGDILLSVSDDGIGVSENFEFKNYHTFGLQMVNALGEQQLQGSVTFESKQGVTCTIRFRDNLYNPRV